MTIVDERAILAAGNNADWYEAMFTVHGLEYRRSTRSFVAKDRPPPCFSKLTVLSPADTAATLAEVKKTAFSFEGAMDLKDSFCQLDLAADGFETLFEANWIWRAPGQATRPRSWEVIRDARSLLRWEDGWTHDGLPLETRMFPDTLLDREDIAFLGLRSADRFVAGCIANRSAECVGMSNMFAETGSAILFSQAADAVAAMWDRKPVVGYEAGCDLEYAKQADFETVGRLRVLVAQNAHFQRDSGCRRTGCF